VTCAIGFYAGIRVEKGQLAGSAAPTAAGTSGAPGNASFGTVAGVSGSTLYVTGATGNTVKVRLSKATKVSKTQSASRGAIHPGDTVVVQGVSGAGGTETAASVADSGPTALRSAGAGALAGAGSGGAARSGPGGTSSAVGSLFSSGG